MTTLHSVPRIDTPLPIERRFSDAFLSLQGPWEVTRPRLDALYAPDIRFRDAIFRFNGKKAFLRGNERMIRLASRIHIHVDSVIAQGDEIFATWNFRYVPKFGFPMKVEGSTYARIRDGQIAYQRDYWDLVGSLLGGIAGMFGRGQD